MEPVAATSMPMVRCRDGAWMLLLRDCAEEEEQFVAASCAIPRGKKRSEPSVSSNSCSCSCSVAVISDNHAAVGLNKSSGRGCLREEEEEE